MYQLIYGLVAKFDFVVKVSFSLLIYVEKPVSNFQTSAAWNTQNYGSSIVILSS